MPNCHCGKFAYYIDDTVCGECWNKRYCICEEKNSDDEACDICFDRIWDEQHKGFVEVVHEDESCFCDEPFIFINPLWEPLQDDFVDPKKYPSIYGKFIPVKNLHFIIFHALRRLKRPWSDLNKATKIIYPYESRRTKKCDDDEYDESREYHEVIIEFGDEKIRDMPKSFYMEDFVLYEYPTNIEKYTEKFSGENEYFLSSEKRWWGGIPFEGYHNNFSDSALMKKKDIISILSLSGEWA